MNKITDLRVEETATLIRAQVPADVLFDFNRAEIKAEAESALGQVAVLIRGGGKGKVRIEGHTDSKGTDAQNQRLSHQRAESVRNWLVQRGGIDRARLTALGIASRKPVAPNARADGSDDPDGRQRNRRVELIIEK